MVLDAQSAAELAREEADETPRVSDPGAEVDEIRRSMVADASAQERPAVAYVEDIDADGVPCRLYRPAPGAPLLLYAHGGGWATGNVDTYDRYTREIAVRTGWAVLSVDYRLAPEHPYPAPLDDVQTALRWARTSIGAYEVDASVVVGAGDSAGANLIAALSLREPGAVAYQVLAYPPLDPVAENESWVKEDIPLLPAADMRWYWDAYAPTQRLLTNPEVAPAYAADLSAMPPTLLISAEHDILRDECESFGVRLAAAGVTVAAQRVLGVGHGFWRRPWDFDAAVTTLDQLAGILAGLRR